MKFLQLKNLKLPFIASIITGAIFLSYMFLIGIPKTQASGYYRLAKQQQGLGALDRADSYFKKALQVFPDSFIDSEYTKFQSAR